MTPGVWSILTQGHNFNTLVEDFQMMLYTKYESSGPCRFGQE